MNKKMSGILIPIILFAALAFPGVSNAGAFQYRSINFCSWGAGEYDSEMVDPALQAIKSLGANIVTLDWAVPFDPVTGGRVAQFDASASVREPSLESVASVADKVRALGMAVIFKPHVGHRSEGFNLNYWNVFWNKDASQFDAGRFFRDWKDYMMQMAILAQQKGSPFLVIGTEMNHVDVAEYRHYWVDLINAVKSVYSGQITYDALISFWEPNRDVKEVGFIDQLDFISLSVYPDLTQNKNASYEELVYGWNKTYHCDGNCYESYGLIDYLLSVYQETGKKIWFSETGFPSYDGSAIYPSNFSGTAPQDLEEQKMATQSLFDVWQNHTNWMMGMSLWEVCPNLWLDKTQPWYVNGYEPFGKPVENVIRHWYKVMPVREFVTRFYQQCFGREPDSEGLNSWTDALLNDYLTGSDVAFSFIFSNEFSGRNTTNEEFLHILYRAFFNRDPDAVGYTGWINTINDGSDRATILEGFLNSQEFINLCSNYGIKP